MSLNQIKEMQRVAIEIIAASKEGKKNKRFNV